MYRNGFQDKNRDMRTIWSEFRLTLVYPSTGHVISDQNIPARQLKRRENDQQERVIEIAQVIL